MNQFAAPKRNQFRARISSIVEAPVLSEIEVELVDGHRMVATISTREVDELGLRVGATVLAVLKANDVAIAVL